MTSCKILNDGSSDVSLRTCRFTKYFLGGNFWLLFWSCCYSNLSFWIRSSDQNRPGSETRTAWKRLLIADRNTSEPLIRTSWDHVTRLPGAVPNGLTHLDSEPRWKFVRTRDPEQLTERRFILNAARQKQGSWRSVADVMTHRVTAALRGDESLRAFGPAEPFGSSLQFWFDPCGQMTSSCGFGRVLTRFDLWPHQHLLYTQDLIPLFIF